MDAIQRRLTEALLATGEEDEPALIDLYRNNVWFHTGLDTLTKMLPVFVRGLVSWAEDQDTLNQAEVEAIRAMPTVWSPTTGPFPNTTESGGSTQ